LDADDALIPLGCACRGAGGKAHLACIIEAHAAKEGDRTEMAHWIECLICTVRVLTMNPAVPELATSRCFVQCTCLDGISSTRMLLRFIPLLRLKRCHACDSLACLSGVHHHLFTVHTFRDVATPKAKKHTQERCSVVCPRTFCGGTSMFQTSCQLGSKCGMRMH
jgi:hypothetical protein